MNHIKLIELKKETLINPGNRSNAEDRCIRSAFDAVFGHLIPEKNGHKQDQLEYIKVIEQLYAN